MFVCVCVCVCADCSTEQVRIYVGIGCEMTEDISSAEYSSAAFAQYFLIYFFPITDLHEYDLTAKRCGWFHHHM